MSSTYPSRILTIIDIPEPSNINAKFVYNFFEANESTSYPSLNNVDLTKGSSLEKISRYVKISYTPPNVDDSYGNINQEFIDNSLLTPSNAALVQTEQSFSNFDFTAINFQDTSLSSKIYSIVSSSIELRGIKEGSPTDAATILSALTSEDVFESILTDALNQSNSTKYFSSDTGLESVKDAFQDLLSIQIHGQINNKVIGTIVRRSAEDPFNPYYNEMSSILSSAESLQAETIANTQAQTIKVSDWDIGFIPLTYASISNGGTSFGMVSTSTQTSTTTAPTAPISIAEGVVTVPPTTSGIDSRVISIVGYIVDKQEIDTKGKRTKHPSIILQGKKVSSYIDTNVKYGSSYAYSVRSVALAQLVVSGDNDTTMIATGLVSSRVSTSYVIQAIDKTPPPPPADFMLTWDYKNACLRLTWSFPINTQQDIKRFQIFKRASVKEPFTLLREYDFDDSVVKYSTGETVDQALIAKLSNPILYFLDDEFGKDDKAIYALCCVDAHGLSSNYSEQFHASFDRFKNTLKVKRISRSMAPKSLPNMYVNENAFIDTIKVSYTDSIEIYFDPEYLVVKDGKQNDLNLLPLKDPNGAYKINIINTDLQTSEVLNIKLEDLRTT